MWCVVCESLIKSVPFWCARMKNAKKDFWRLCYFKTQEEEWFTVLPENSSDQQLSVERWDPRDADFIFRDFVVQKICMDLQLEG